MAQKNFMETLLSLRPQMEQYINATITRYSFLADAEREDVVQNCLCRCLEVKEKKDVREWDRYLFGVIKKSLKEQNTSMRKEKEIIKRYQTVAKDYHTDRIDCYIQCIRDQIKATDKSRKMMNVFESLILSEGNMRKAGKYSGYNQETMRRYRGKIDKIYKELAF